MCPRDTNGNPLTEGRYLARAGRQQCVMNVFEDDHGNLLALPILQVEKPHPQRVDEMAAAVIWEPIELDGVVEVEADEPDSSNPYIAKMSQLHGIQKDTDPASKLLVQYRDKVLAILDLPTYDPRARQLAWQFLLGDIDASSLIVKASSVSTAVA